MAGMGAGYDLSVSTFSPDGRVFQVEYASKAVDNSPLCMAAACKDGVVFAVEKPKGSMMLAPGSNRRIYPVSKDIGMVIAGLVPDGRQLWHRARAESRAYTKAYGIPIPTAVLAERLALFMHAFSLYWHVRPFGATCIVGGLQKDPKTGYKSFAGEVYAVDPSGCCSRYSGTAAGNNRPSAKTELEKLQLQQLDTRTLGEELVRVLLQLQQEAATASEAKTEIEVGCLRLGGPVDPNPPVWTDNYLYDLNKEAAAASGDAAAAAAPQFQLWSQEEVAAAVAKAKAALEAMDSD